MPVVEQQTRRGNGMGDRVVTEKSILSRAIAAGDLPEFPLKILMYGGNRVGKTTLACKNGKRTLLISCETAVSGGLESIRKIPGVMVLRYRQHFRGTKDLVYLARELERGGYKDFDYVILDTVTSVQDVVLSELLGLPKVPDQASWGTVPDGFYISRSEKTREVLRPFLDLPVNTIFLGKEKDHNPPKEVRFTSSGKEAPDMTPKFLLGVGEQSYVAAELGGATLGWLQDGCDCICRLSVQEEIVRKEVRANGKVKVREHGTGKYIRYLRTGYHPNFSAGIRSCTPELVPEFIAKPTMPQLVAVIRGVGSKDGRMGGVA
jgi:AAA domain